MAKVLQFVKDYLSQRKEKMDVISYLEEQLELKDLQKMTKIELDENSLTAFIDVGKIDDYLSRNFIKVKFNRSLQPGISGRSLLNVVNILLKTPFNWAKVE